VLDCQELASASHANLNLIINEKDIPFLAQAFQSDQELSGRDNKPGMPLHGFDDERGDVSLLVQALLGHPQTLKAAIAVIIAVIAVGVGEPKGIPGIRSVLRLVNDIIIGQHHGTVGVAMERPGEAGDSGLAGMCPCQFDGCLDSHCPADWVVHLLAR
jgi:hypothetical protein